ncbi:MAG: hypothetical protein ABI678_21825 [Kofleriaceae bacterium]
MRLWFVACLTACGFSPAVPRDGAPIDGASDTGSDSGGVPQSCITSWFGPSLHFTPRRHLDPLATSHTERDPTLSHNELQIWFQSDRGGGPGGTDVFTATRSAIDQPFGTPVVFTDASSAQDEGRYAISADELSYAISSSRAGTHGGFDVWVSHRDTGGENFPPADNTKLGSVDDGSDQLDPWINNDATRLYYAPTAGGQHIMLATRSNAMSSFGSPAAMTELNIGQPTADPTLFDDELVVVFSTVTDANVGGATNTDLWYATRLSISDPFGAPVHLGELSTSNYEGDAWVSADGCHVYFAAETGGDYDLYQADVTF